MYRKIRCPRCNTSESMRLLEHHVSSSDETLLINVKKHLKIESNPSLQFCPKNICDKYVNTGSCRTNIARGATCE